MNIFKRRLFTYLILTIGCTSVPSVKPLDLRPNPPTILITTVPPGAAVLVDCKGNLNYYTSPAIIQVSNKHSCIVEIKKEGYVSIKTYFPKFISSSKLYDSPYISSLEWVDYISSIPKTTNPAAGIAWSMQQATNISKLKSDELWIYKLELIPIKILKIANEGKASDDQLLMLNGLINGLGDWNYELYP